ncbi:benzoate 4-monooxygenase Cytochrome-P450 like protein [Teratosphaeria destructans]|uniref:Benzoate 4-monooxygenase Cytochrome-P450 like protein n=1 Tax=Teratosphaeria destructans TaxID=418781 RepID=A0A9W7W2U3_9PEZI|nr:benzoate 4-monooxygenase Cytochrome-P450 like protein [Teratosphaeria destructans]
MALMSAATSVVVIVISCLSLRLWRAFYKYHLHPLKNIPGPKLAQVGRWYKPYQELVKGRCWNAHLHELHQQYGEVVRVASDELHFSNPQSYQEIYNNTNRWDKEESVYHSFGEDRSSFGFLTYREAKARKDVLAPLFSKRAISELQGLVQKNIDRLCAALAADDARGKSSDMLFGLRCFALDTIMEYCFAQDVKATEAPDFQSPIVVAMDASLPSFIVFRHFSLVRKLVFSFPGWLTKASNPVLAGLVDMQELLGAQVTRVVRDPSVLEKSPHPIIYHRLLDPELNKVAGVPSAGSLYEEAQALLFGGADSVGNTTMTGLYHILKAPEIYQKLKAEVASVWSVFEQPPKVEDLEKLPYLTAVIKESLRVSPGVVSGLPRVIPPSGATIATLPIPGGTIVSMSANFVHYSSALFPDPQTFRPERWIQPDSGELEKWLVAFSKGPRACLGQNLGMCELYVAFAALIRRFDMTLDGTKDEDFKFRDTFLPSFQGRHMRAFCKPVGQ